MILIFPEKIVLIMPAPSLYMKDVMEIPIRLPITLLKTETLKNANLARGKNSTQQLTM